MTEPRKFPGTRRFGGARGLGQRALLLIALAAAAQCANAQMTLDPYVDAHVEHDSNVFRLPNSQTAVMEVGDPTLGDTDLKYLAGLDGVYLWSQQQLTGKFEVGRYDYDHYKDLDHTEYLADVTLKWKLTSLLDGSLDAKQTSAMAPFALGNSPQLTIDVDRDIDGKANLNFNPDWRLEAGLYSHNLKTPLLDFPDFVENEVGSHLGIVNLSITDLTYGIGFDHIAGRFENAPDVGSYSQNSVQLRTNYTVSALTTLNASVGYTKRSQNADAGDTSAVTGSLGYTRQLTGKTSLSVQFTRAINSYVAAGASEIDTSATLSLNWQATYKIGVAVSGGFTHSTFVGEAVPGSDANGRVDHSPSESLNVTYQILRHLRLLAYLSKQARSSDIELYNFSDTIAGIDAKWSWR